MSTCQKAINTEKTASSQLNGCEKQVSTDPCNLTTSEQDNKPTVIRVNE